MTAEGAVTATRRGDRDALAAARRDAVAAARARARPRRTVGVVVRDVVITLLGLAGVVVIAWTVLSRMLGLSLVVLLTGSMAPTLPTGSVAIMADAVPAADLEVGDVIKVQRPGYDLPVTHRIISIGAVTGEVEQPSAGVDPQDPAARQVVLQGDANETADPAPYVIASADRVVFGVPYLGYANRILHTPLVLIGLAGALLLLLVGTSLPSGRSRGRRVAGADAGPDADPDEDRHVATAAAMSAPARARRSALTRAAARASDAAPAVGARAGVTRAVVATGPDAQAGA
ncbi:signal peptidase I, partial [Clavibacter tessellarius]